MPVPPLLRNGLTLTFPILPFAVFLFFPLNSGPCLGHFKHVYNGDDDDSNEWIKSGTTMK